jgi:hypothetical protein
VSGRHLARAHYYSFLAGIFYFLCLFFVVAVDCVYLRLVSYRKAGVFVSETKSSNVPGDTYCTLAHVALEVARKENTHACTGYAFTDNKCGRMPAAMSIDSLQLPARLVSTLRGLRATAFPRATTLFPHGPYIHTVAGYGHVLCFAAISYRRRCSCLAVYATPWRESQAERDREMRQR